MVEIIVAEPHGFCKGVKRAINILDDAVLKYKIVFCFHEIVHNSHVVDAFKKKGVIFVDDINAIPDGSVLVFSAHGVSPKIKEIAKAKNLIVIDSTCPLVELVHKKVRDYAEKDHAIIYVGKKGHAEVEGVKGESDVFVVSSIDDVNNLDIKNKNIVCLSQTTLSVDDTKKITDVLSIKFPEMKINGGICDATQQRQDAVKKLAKTCELIIVLGDKNSSNSNRLVETAKKLGISSHLILDVSEFEKAWIKDIKKIGITSGASCPEFLFDEFVKYVKKIKEDPKITTK